VRNRSLKNLITISLALLCGCAYTRTIAVVPHADGSGTNYYKYLVAGGIIRPGVIVVFTETIGSNAGPAVLTQGIGPPIAPSVTGAAGNVAAAATLSGLWPDQSDNDSTTVIANPPHAPMIDPPRPVHPPNAPSRPSFNRPPNNRPPNNRPPNRGH
jgi:hypothetical protein